MNELLFNALNSTGHDVFALVAPQNKTPPFAVYTAITTSAEMCADGLTDLSETNYSLDVYGFDYEQVKTIMGDFLNAIMLSNDFKYIIYNVTDGIESDGKTVRTSLDFTLWNK